MRIIDASSIIHGWDNYPIDQFEKLWDWLGSEFANNDLQIPKCALKETRNKAPDCASWLEINGITVIPEVMIF